MVREIVKDAIHIKMKARMESPLISVYEFCYAAGLGLKIMGTSAEEAEQLKNLEFLEFKSKVQDAVRGSQAFADAANGERLKSLIVGCRIKKGEMSEDARALFDMGFH